jgi:hypothetical protein
MNLKGRGWAARDERWALGLGSTRVEKRFPVTAVMGHIAFALSIHKNVIRSSHEKNPWEKKQTIHYIGCVA